MCMFIYKIRMRNAQDASTRRIPSPLRDVKKKAGRPSATCARVSSLSFAEVRLVAIHHAFYPRAHCEAIVHRTSHPVLVPMTSAMGIFTRESLIPPWESSLHRPKIRAHCTKFTCVVCACVLVIRLDYIFRSRDRMWSLLVSRGDH